MTGDASVPRLRDASIRLDSMPADGRDVVIAPSQDERAALAAEVGVTSVEALEVRLHAVKFRGGFRVTGRLSAEVTQPSVLTLEPVRQSITEPIDRIFLPSGEKSYAGPAGAEVFVDVDGEDVPDHFEGSEADLSGLVVETLALNIDLYPRGPSDSLDPALLNPDPPIESPFAVLKAIKDKSS
jgi:uncharacterized metal-binding protein YceD (DUF177 family)